MGGKKRRQQRDQHESDQDAQAEEPLPVGAKELPDLADVPDQQFCPVTERGSPDPEGAGEQEQEHSLEQPAEGCGMTAGRPVGQPAGDQRPSQKQQAGADDDRCAAPPRRVSDQTPDAPGEADQPAGDQQPCRVGADPPIDEATQHAPCALADVPVFWIPGQLEQQPEHRRPQNDPVLQAPGDHACTLGSR